MKRLNYKKIQITAVYKLFKLAIDLLSHIHYI